MLTQVLEFLLHGLELLADFDVEIVLRSLLGQGVAEARGHQRLGQSLLPWVGRNTHLHLRWRTKQGELVH